MTVTTVYVAGFRLQFVIISNRDLASTLLLLMMRIEMLITPVDGRSYSVQPPVLIVREEVGRRRQSHSIAKPEFYLW